MRQPLCWDDWSGVSKASAARTRFGGHYAVYFDGDHFMVRRHYPSGGYGFLGQAETLAEAKSIAQVDYETR
jgi:hypothetical protein